MPAALLQVVWYLKYSERRADKPYGGLAAADLGAASIAITAPATRAAAASSDGGAKLWV